MRFFKKIIIGSVLFISSLSLSFAFSDKAAASDSHGAVRMHRLYNPNSGEHFYTGDVSEKNGLITEGGTTRVLPGTRRVIPCFRFTGFTIQTPGIITIRWM